MDKQWFNKCRKAHANILKCIEEAYKAKNIDVMLTNVQRLTALTSHYEKSIDVDLNQVRILEIENKTLEDENRRLSDEQFLSISESKGRYQEAKKQLEEFYGAERN